MKVVNISLVALALTLGMAAPAFSAQQEEKQS
jgi:hypothetical protein